MSEWQMTMGWGAESVPVPRPCRCSSDRPVGSGGSQPQFCREKQARRCRCGFLEGCAGRGGEPLPQYYEQQQGFGVSARTAARIPASWWNATSRTATSRTTAWPSPTWVIRKSCPALPPTLTTAPTRTRSPAVPSPFPAARLLPALLPAAKNSVCSSPTIPGSVSATPGDSSFKTDTTTVTLNANNVTDATYTTSEGKSGSYQDGDTITIGASTAGDTITVKLQGKDADGQTVSATYKYTKKENPAATSTAYAKKPSAWSNLYAYVYVDDSSATTLEGQTRSGRASR